MSIPRQDFYTIEGQNSPGVCQILNLVVPKGWKENAGTAISGATLVPIGDPLATWTIRHLLWDGPQFDSWDDWARAWFEQTVISPVSTQVTSGRVLSISHPWLRASPWRQAPCVVTTVHGYVKSDKGLYSVDVDFKQWRKPVPVPSRPTAAIPDTAASQPTAQDATQAAIERAAAARDALRLRDQGTP